MHLLLTFDQPNDLLSFAIADNTNEKIKPTHYATWLGLCVQGRSQDITLMENFAKTYTYSDSGYIHERNI